MTEILRYRSLLLSLAWRDVRVRYKQSLLGILWAVLLPLAMMLVFTFVFTRAINAGVALDVRMPYALFAYGGLLPWTFFAGSLSACTNSLVANRNLITKVYFPREVFPFSCVLGALVDFAIGAGVLLGLIAYFHTRGGWSYAPSWSLILLPLVLLIQIVLTVGLGMLLAMANLFYRDVRQVFGVAIQLLMFVSAVVVPVPHDGSPLATLIRFNPLVPIIEAYRACVLEGSMPGALGLIYAAIVAVIACCGGWICFRRASYRFAESI